jgi:hypothetical protein
VFEDEYSTLVGKRSVKSLCFKNPTQTREYPSSNHETVSAPCYRFFIPSPFTTRWIGRMERDGFKNLFARLFHIKIHLQLNKIKREQLLNK